MLNSEALAESASASTGRVVPFGKYLLLQRVNVGGMAEVFKALPAHADRIDQIVAIKRILPNIAEDNEFIGMFVDEARIAGQLNHPNICRIYELGRVGNDHYIAMQFLWGRDLLKIMNRYKKAGRFVAPSMAAFVGVNALAALHYAHLKCDEHGRPLNIIHRDVSPQNIIVGYSGQVKLIDFGVARAASQSQRTQAGILKGKFGYMSPEMIRGLPIDHRSDVFAMGICLHELLTSARLFYGETDFATLELVRDANVVPPSHKAPGVPPALDAIVMKALSREVEDRYQSAEEMQLALEDFLAEHDPLYGQVELGLAMRQAFHTEVQRERERLELFWRMLERGELVRGALIPSHPPSTGQRSEQGDSPVGALLEGDPLASLAEEPDDDLLEEEDDGVEVSDDELREEQTHIFFSASELDEIRELEAVRSQRAAPPRRMTLSDMVPPAPPASEALPTAPVIAAPVIPVAASSAAAARAPTWVPPPPPQHAPTERVRTHRGQQFHPRARPMAPRGGPRRRRSGRFARYALFTLLALVLGVTTYAGPRFASAGTGALEIESVGDPDALVRVDGIVRGNPPLVVEGLTPGVHQVEVEATGFEVARAEVQVEKGRAHGVKLVLEKVAAAPAAAQPGASAPVTPEVTSLAEAQAKPPRDRTRAPARSRGAEEAPVEEASVAPAAAQERSARRERPARAEIGDEEEANATPIVEEGGSSETQFVDELDHDMAAANEGELLISTVPWSHVFVDGEDTGRDTPVRALRVPAGPHRIGLRTPDEVTHEVDVMVEAGQVVRIIRRF